MQTFVPGAEDKSHPAPTQFFDHSVVTERAEIARLLVGAEVRHEVDALLLIALIEQESQFRSNSRSRKGAQGMLQIMPLTAKDVAQRHGIAFENRAEEIS